MSCGKWECLPPLEFTLSHDRLVVQLLKPIEEVLHEMLVSELHNKDQNFYDHNLRLGLVALPTLLPLQQPRMTKQQILLHFHLNALFFHKLIMDQISQLLIVLSVH